MPKPIRISGQYFRYVSASPLAPFLTCAFCSGQTRVSRVTRRGTDDIAVFLSGAEEKQNEMRDAATSVGLSWRIESNGRCCTAKLIHYCLGGGGKRRTSNEDAHAVHAYCMCCSLFSVTDCFAGRLLLAILANMSTSHCTSLCSIIRF